MHKSKLHYAWIILGAGVIGIMNGVGLARFGYSVILPAMKDGLGLSYGQMGLLGTGNLLGYLCFALLGGYLASRLGNKIVIVLSMAFMTIALMLTGMAGGFAGALAARIFTGIGSAGVNVPIMSLASVWFATRRRGMAAGILVSGSGFGVLITGIFLPGIINAHGADGWRWAWYSLAALSLAITPICHFLLKDTPAEKNCSPYGAEKASVTFASAPEQVTEATSPPLNWGKVYKNPALWQLGLVYFAYGFAYISIPLFLRPT
ncbi:MAG: MFS transporter [Deltaproteobacteria bacterium]|nr:MFS transporter [Deltaproteobacteria bacterium]